MRIFINLADESGSKRTLRLHLTNCTTTSFLLTQICKEIGSKKNKTIVKLKYEPCNLIIVEDWPLSIYPIKSGSTFLVEFSEKYKYQELSQSTQSLPKVAEEDAEYQSQNQKEDKMSFISDKSQRDDLYLQQCLKRMLEAIKEGDLDKVASILKEEPEIDDERELQKFLQQKSAFLINEMGDNGRNALHQAINAGNIDIVSFLLIKGTNLRAKTQDQFTPLQLAVKNRSPQIMRILLEQKITDINEVTSWGTALHMVVINEDARCLQVLLQYDVDTQIVNGDGEKPIEICSNKKIKEMLQKKSKLIKIKVPNISKGNVFQVSPYMYRHSFRMMVLNPFKQELIIEKQSKEIKYKHPLQEIKYIRIIQDKGWLMNNSYFYFKICLKGEEKDQILIGLKHEKTYSRWIKNFDQVLESLDNAAFRKPVPPSQQIVQIINDDTNSITLHKRKVPEVPKQSKIDSIMNLRVSKNIYEPNYFINESKNSNNLLNSPSTSYSREQLMMKSSEVIAGSVLDLKQSSERSPKSDFSFPDVMEEPFALTPASTDKVDSSTFRFKKTSSKTQNVSEFKLKDKTEISINDFQIIKQIGNGSFGQVYLVKHSQTSKIYALKVLNKKKLIAKKQLKYAVSQVNILKKMESPFIVTLHYSFQTPQNLYMALDNCPNGDLSEVIINRQKLQESTACFVIAQVVLAVQYLHSKGVLYRDMKPENILIASDGYIKLTDFGLSKENCFSASFCGSPAYLSPEMLQKKGVGFETDIYGIGTVLYEMVIGEPPFYDDDMDVMFDNIKNSKLRYPSYLSIQVKSLISKLLQRDVSKRLGVKDFTEIKKHDFFKKLNWKHLAAKKLIAPDQLFSSEQDIEQFQPIHLQKKETIKIQDDSYSEGNSVMMNRVKNFTFVRGISRCQEKETQKN